MVLCFAIRVVVVVEGAIRKPPFSCTGRPITGMQYNNFGGWRERNSPSPPHFDCYRSTGEKQAKRREGGKETNREGKYCANGNEF